MQDITSQWGSTSPGSGVSRRTGRAISHLNDQTDIAIARARAQAEAFAAKVEAMGFVTQRAAQAATFMSQVEQQLVELVPLAASRVESIGNVGTLGMTQLVMDAANALRRA